MGGEIRIPPYLDARPGRQPVVRELAVPVPGPAVVIVWPDAPSRHSVERVARMIEWALRAAWPAVATDSAEVS